MKSPQYINIRNDTRENGSQNLKSLWRECLMKFKEFASQVNEWGVHATEITEAEYQGKKVKLNDPIRGGSKKFYVYVKDGDKVKKVSFVIQLVINKERRSTRRRIKHNCDNLS